MLRTCVSTIGALAVSFSAALAADPTGEWLTEGGIGQVRIENCGDRLWGVVSWEKVPGGIDSYNPDPAKRNRPTLGLPVLLGMAQTQQNLWEGEIYNAENGKTYSSKISLRSADVLRVEGCVLGFLCGGQDWTRVITPPAPATTKRPPAKSAHPPARPFQTAQEVCAAATGTAPPPPANPNARDRRS